MIDFHVDLRDMPIGEMQQLMISMFEKDGIQLGAIPMTPTKVLLWMFEGRE